MARFMVEINGKKNKKFHVRGRSRDLQMGRMMISRHFTSAPRVLPGVTKGEIEVLLAFDFRILSSALRPLPFPVTKIIFYLCRNYQIYGI
jgi:hypothetical protein